VVVSNANPSFVSELIESLVPDLAFSEMAFLRKSHRQPASSEKEVILSKSRAKDRRKKERARNEISNYFSSAKSPLQEIDINNLKARSQFKEASVYTKHSAQDENHSYRQYNSISPSRSQQQQNHGYLVFGSRLSSPKRRTTPRKPPEGIRYKNSLRGANTSASKPTISYYSWSESLRPSSIARGKEQLDLSEAQRYSTSPASIQRRLIESGIFSNTGIHPKPYLKSGVAQAKRNRGNSEQSPNQEQGPSDARGLLYDRSKSPGHSRLTKATCRTDERVNVIIEERGSHSQRYEHRPERNRADDKAISPKPLDVSESTRKQDGVLIQQYDRDHGWHIDKRDRRPLPSHSDPEKSNETPQVCKQTPRAVLAQAAYVRPPLTQPQYMRLPSTRPVLERPSSVSPSARVRAPESEGRVNSTASGAVPQNVIANLSLAAQEFDSPGFRKDRYVPPSAQNKVPETQAERQRSRTLNLPLTSKVDSSLPSSSWTSTSSNASTISASFSELQRDMPNINGHVNNQFANYQDHDFQLSEMNNFPYENGRPQAESLLAGESDMAAESVLSDLPFRGFAQTMGQVQSSHHRTCSPLLMTEPLHSRQLQNQSIIENAQFFQDLQDEEMQEYDPMTEENHPEFLDDPYIFDEYQPAGHGEHLIYGFEITEYPVLGQYDQRLLQENPDHAMAYPTSFSPFHAYLRTSPQQFEDYIQRPSYGMEASFLLQPRGFSAPPHQYQYPDRVLENDAGHDTNQRDQLHGLPFWRPQRNY
jgi:hypothetical protein